MLAELRPCIVVEQNDPTGELPWSLRFDRLTKDGQGNSGHSLLPHAVGSLIRSGPSCSKKNVSIILPALVCMVLDFFGGCDPGCFHWRFSRFDSGSKR